MSKLQLLKQAVTRTAGRSGLFIKRFSPEILTGIGVVGVVASTVLACKATLKVESVLDEAKENIDKIKFAKETVPQSKYSETDYKKDMATQYVQTGVKLVKLYGPAITIGVASIGCILGGHNIMRKRNVALVAAYKTLESGFNKYRKRVVEEYGAETDYRFKNGIRKVETGEMETVVDEKGKTKKVPKTIDVVEGGPSIYARYFDENNPEWQDVPEFNLMYLRCKQNYANDKLRAQGHLFLNEVYDMLDIPRTQEGSVVGWVMSKNGDGDNYVDFGMYDVNVTGYASDRDNDTIGEQRRDFINGYKTAVLLDFNVDGVIFDKI